MQPTRRDFVKALAGAVAAAAIPNVATALATPGWANDSWDSQGELQRTIDNHIMPFLGEAMKEYRHGWNPHMGSFKYSFVPDEDFYVEAVEKPMQKRGFKTLVPNGSPEARARDAAIDMFPSLVLGVYDDKTQMCYLPGSLVGEGHKERGSIDQAFLNFTKRIPLVKGVVEGAEKVAYGEAFGGRMTYGNIAEILGAESFHHSQHMQANGPGTVMGARDALLHQAIGKNLYVDDGSRSPQAMAQLNALMTLIEGDEFLFRSYLNQQCGIEGPKPNLISTLLVTALVAMDPDLLKKANQYQNGARRILEARDIDENRADSVLPKLYRNPGRVIRDFS